MWPRGMRGLLGSPGQQATLWGHPGFMVCPAWPRLREDLGVPGGTCSGTPCSDSQWTWMWGALGSFIISNRAAGLMSFLNVSWTAPGPWGRLSPGSSWGPRYQALPRPIRTKREVGRCPHCSMGTCIWPPWWRVTGLPRRNQGGTATAALQPQTPWKMLFNEEAGPVKAMREKEAGEIPKPRSNCGSHSRRHHHVPSSCQCRVS
ncbi:uncharacterized protein LOC101015644 [Papio anubis]|uniref:uncharacterized protein LOC101015644 n=1 Tax=Papio anubis TaxID=9555 RepID=UPI0012AD7191|nr:uncharacterized protein LOC101015644 [Papio anubis]